MNDHYTKVGRETPLLSTAAPSKRWFDRKTIAAGVLALVGICGVAYGSQEHQRYTNLAQLTLKKAIEKTIAGKEYYKLAPLDDESSSLYMMGNR